MQVPGSPPRQEEHASVIADTFSRIQDTVSRMETKLAMLHKEMMSVEMELMRHRPVPVVMERDALGDHHHECAICLCLIVDKHKTTACHHTFHRHCLDQWLETSSHQSCPICRSSVSTSSYPCIEHFLSDPGADAHVQVQVHCWDALTRFFRSSL